MSTDSSAPRRSGVLYATDLDRTLIYSERAAGVPVAGLVPVETYRDRVISWVTPTQLDLLAAVEARAAVVPVTTRTVAQYERITLWPGPRPWAVTTNGGTILRDGRPDADWRARVEAELASHCHDLAAVAEQVGAALGPWMDHTRVADDLFVYTLVDRAALPPPAVADLSASLDPAGWVVSVQGRKLYAVPRPLTKSAAVAEIRARTGAATLIAAGDAVLDRDLLDAADLSLRPAHGELHDLGVPADVVTRASGVAAGEELLRTVLHRLSPPGGEGTTGDDDFEKAGGRVPADQRAAAARARTA